MYVGSFERNFPTLIRSHRGASWRSSAHGLRNHDMEKSGKKFVVVRIADRTSDVVLVDAMALVPGEHFGFGVRVGPEPTHVDDGLAIRKLLEDVTKKHAGASAEPLPMRARLKARASRR
jgi:hypothetical protein